MNTGSYEYFQVERDVPVALVGNPKHSNATRTSRARRAGRQGTPAATPIVV